MEEIENFLENLEKIKFVSSLIIILVSIVLCNLILYILNKSESKSKIRLFTSSRSKTYFRLIKSIIKSVFGILTVLIVLQINGINVDSVLAGVGIFGIIFGLAIQDWLKDIIRGSCILSDEYFKVGDIVKYKNIEGKVLVIGLKSTKIKDLSTSNIISIANRNIEEVEVVSNLIHIRIPMPYEINVEKAEKVVNEIVESVKKNSNVIGCTYKGVAEFADSSIEYLIEVTGDPQYKLEGIH